jgi:hypothetical protein
LNVAFFDFAPEIQIGPDLFLFPAAKSSLKRSLLNWQNEIQNSRMT